MSDTQEGSPEPNETVAPHNDADTPKVFIESYQSFARTLRAWLIAYGIGAPVLFTSQEAFTRLLDDQILATQIIKWFLGGVVIQVGSVLMYKGAMWYVYYGNRAKETRWFKKTIRYRVSDLLSEAILFELILDALSIGCFARATYLVVHAFVAGAC